MINYKKSFKWIYWILGGIFFLVFLNIIWLYSGTITSAKTKIFQKAPLPMALINGHGLPMNNFLVRFNVAQKTLGPEVAQKIKSSIAEQLIKEAQISQLAWQKDISVSQKQVDEEFLAVAGQTNLKGAANFKDFLAARGLTESIFKNGIIKQELILKQLHIWFNSQPGLSPEGYKLANSLLEQIKNGGDMAALAAQFTEDDAGKATSGDMGFLQTTELSPELREEISSLKLNETKIISGLSGLHIIRLEQQVGNQLKLREIFFKTSGFDSWLDNQLKNFKVIRLIKI